MKWIYFIVNTSMLEVIAISFFFLHFLLSDFNIIYEQFLPCSNFCSTNDNTSVYVYCTETNFI